MIPTSFRDCLLYIVHTTDEFHKLFTLRQMMFEGNLLFLLGLQRDLQKGNMSWNKCIQYINQKRAFILNDCHI